MVRHALRCRVDDGSGVCVCMCVDCTMSVCVFVQYTHIQTNTHTHAHVHTHAHMHTFTHSHTHTHTRTNTHDVAQADRGDAVDGDSIHGLAGRVAAQVIFFFFSLVLFFFHAIEGDCIWSHCHLIATTGPCFSCFLSLWSFSVSQLFFGFNGVSFYLVTNYFHLFTLSGRVATRVWVLGVGMLTSL
jgi:hypothetical protein